MACQNMHFWTVTGLVGAFLDLAIAYFLLCASTMAFFASEFLAVFGLKLPCPCNGLFTNSSTSYCLQRLLVDCPIEKISAVQFSVRNKFPFHSVLVKEKDVGTKLIGDRSNYGDGYYVELEDEASSSSVSDAKVSQNVRGRELVPRNGNCFEFDGGRWPDRKLDLKGKGISYCRPKVNIRRRRRGDFEHRKSSSVLSYDQVVVPRYSSSTSKEQNDTSRGRSAPVDDEVEANYFPDNEKAPSFTNMGDRGLHDIDLNISIDEKKPKERSESSNEEIQSDERCALSLGGEINTIKILEQALREENNAYAAVYVELEKERSAAATAADEAMAMIQRLQEDKASIEMQARQYQRIIEEKSAYDAEEMNILKEILLMREREKHFLEKEVEAYRQALYSGKEQSEVDFQYMVDNQRQEFSSSLDMFDDTDTMLHELSESIKKKEVAKSRRSNVEIVSNDTQRSPVTQLGSPEGDNDDVVSQHQDKDKHFSLKCSYDGDQELQEKEMVSVYNSQRALPVEGQRSKNSQEHHLHEKIIPFVGKEQKKVGSEDISEGLSKNVNTPDKSGMLIQSDSQNMAKHEKDATLGSKVTCNVTNDKEPHVFDVHVINDNSKFCDEVSGKKTELLLRTDTSKVITGDVPHEVSNIKKNENRRDSSSSSRLELDTSTDFDRSSLDIPIGLPPLGLMGKSLPASQRSSISASDAARLKIETEVDWLREKLTAVRERRKKLNISVDQDKEKLQLQLLEDIACQLQEIRQMTLPEKATRQVSLPPPSSKSMSKKRRCPRAYINNSS